MTNVLDDVVPISSLFFDDAGPHIVSAASERYTSARGKELHNLLGTSIAQLGAVSGGTRKTPAPPPPVPIESLLYKGRAALDRALEIRDAARRSTAALTGETIHELLDLIGLAAKE